MLGAYYTKGYDTHTLFAKLKIAGSKNFESHINKYNVIHIDFSSMPDFCDQYRVYIKSIVRKLQEDLLETYPALAGRELSTPVIYARSTYGLSFNKAFKNFIK